MDGFLWEEGGRNTPLGYPTFPSPGEMMEGFFPTPEGREKKSFFGKPWKENFFLLSP